jgi:hypothetical protein
MPIRFGEVPGQETRRGLPCLRMIRPGRLFPQIYQR